MATQRIDRRAFLQVSGLAGGVFLPVNGLARGRRAQAATRSSEGEEDIAPPEDEGFEKMVERVATIERTLGIYDLAQLTA